MPEGLCNVCGVLCRSVTKGKKTVWEHAPEGIVFDHEPLIQDEKV